MNSPIFVAVVSACVSVFPSFCHAANSTAPALVVGVQGSYTEQAFNGRGKAHTDYMPEGGIFASLGNKMTSIEGVVYQAEIVGLYSEHQDQKVKDGQADLDLGWRVAWAGRHSADILLGGGYKWNHLQSNAKIYQIDLTNRMPFAKLAVGYNYRFDTATLRAEAGVRKSMGGDSRLEIQGISDEQVDLKDSITPFAEVSLLINQDGSVPVVGSIYYSRFEYELDGNFLMTATDRQVRDEYGLKVGVSF